MSRVKTSLDHKRIRRLIWLVLTVFVLLGYSLQSAAGSIYYSIWMQAYGTVSSPPVILEEGTAGTSTIYTNSTSAKVSVAAPTPITLTYYPNSYNIVTGTYLSGSVPASVQAVDTDYFIVRSSATGTSTTAYNASGYNLFGSTKYLSGVLSDLQSDNNFYMTFRSYVSASNTTAKTDAFIAYRSNTGTNTTSSPKNRPWDGDTVAWGSEVEMSPSAGSPVRWVRTAVCPISQRALEKIVVTLSDNGYLDAYVFDGTSWTATNDIGFPGTTAAAYKCFDVAYEKTTGRALLVYSRGTTSNEIGYKIWTFGSGWGSENLFNLGRTSGIVRFISLAMAPGTRSGTGDDNEIALMYLDANTDTHGYVWTGSTWSEMGATAVWDSSCAIGTKECIAVAYEQTTGEALFIWGDSLATDFQYRTWDGTTLSAKTLLDIASAALVGGWCTLKADPSSDDLFFAVGTSSTTVSELETAYWSGSAWTVHTEHDAALDSNAQRPYDFAWEPTGGKGLLVYGTTADYITYETFTAPNTWVGPTNIEMGSGGTHPWVQLRTNTRSISGDMMILGAVLEATYFDLGGIRWDGTTFTKIGVNTFTAATTIINYECFEMEFNNFGDPTEFTSEVEFTGTSDTQSWIQLVWTIDSSFTATSVTTTFQLFNYTADAYPESGDGYITDTIGTTDVTKTQTITTNPTNFRDGSGNWRIKVKGVKIAATQFDFKADWIEFKPTHYSEYTVSTEFLFSYMTENTPMQLNFTAVSQYNISSVSVTIQVWNYSSLSYVTSGEGYLTYTSAGANETKLLSINTNPQFYTSAGNAKINITSVLTTTTQYQQEINQIKLDYSYGTPFTYDYVLKVVNQVTAAWNISLKVYDSSNIDRLLNATISFYDGASSDQIIVGNGNITQPEGRLYNLPGGVGSTVKISMSNLQASTSGTSYLYVYLKILVPDTTTYLLYIITFEIT